MAKKRILNKGYKPIKNAHLIGRGGKHIKPKRGSWVKGYNQAFGAKVKTVPIKSPLKSKAGFVAKKSISHAKKVKAITTPQRFRGMQRLRANTNKSTPSSKMKMLTRKAIKRKPPTRGR